MNTMLEQNKTVRYNLLIPVIGVTVKVCITMGKIHVYGSTSTPNPNSAFHDFFIELDYEKHENETEVCGYSTYVEPCNTSPSPHARGRRQTSESGTDAEVVYLSIVGMAEGSSFVVNGVAGDISHDVIVKQAPPSSDAIITQAPPSPDVIIKQTPPYRDVIVTQTPPESKHISLALCTPQ